MKYLGCSLALLLFLPVIAACTKQDADSNRPDASPEFVVIYTSVDESRLKPLYEGFTNATGIRVQQVSADFDKLLEMMHDRQWRPAADVFLAGDSATLWRAASQDIFRPTYSDDIESSVPVRLRDADSLFTGFAMTANAIIYDGTTADKVVPTDYESLASPEWRRKLCLTSSSMPQNIGWVSLLLSRHGKREAEMTVRRMVGNLALPVFDDVVELIAAVESGRCGVAIADLQAAVMQLSGHAGAGAAVMTPSANQGGTQVDVFGAGVTRHAANAGGAVRFLEWLTASDGQKAVAASGIGLPVSEAVTLPSPLAEYLAISFAETGVSRLAELSEEAIALVERAHYP
jgi:iron(III) transport system substrate-binding protein